MKRKKLRPTAPPRAIDAPRENPGGRPTAPPRASDAPPPQPSTSPSRLFNAPPDPSLAARNSTTTHRHSSPATPQETGVQTRSKHLQFGSISSEHEPHPPRLVFGSVNPRTPPTHNSVNSDAPLHPRATTRKPTDTTSLAPGNSSSRSPAELQPPGARGNSSSSKSPAELQSPPGITRPPPKDPTSPRRNSSSRSPAELQPPGARGYSSSRSPAEPQGITRPPPKDPTSPRRNSSSSSPAELQSPPGITRPPPKDPTSPRRNSPAPKPKEMTMYAVSSWGNSSSTSPATLQRLGNAKRPPQQDPARRCSPGTTRNMANATSAQGNSPASSSPHQRQQPLDKSSTPPSKMSSGKKTSHIGTPAAAGTAHEKNGPTGSGSKSRSASGGKGTGRYNLRPRQQKNTPARQPAAPTTQPKRSSLTMTDDDMTVQLYFHFLRKHEKPNAAKVLLSGEPLKLTINFKSMLKSNRRLAHTICNNRDRLWNSLLGASRNFLLEQLEDLSSRTAVQGITEETIRKGLPELQLVFKYIPSNICTLLDFLDTTALTALEEVLEGHLIIVLSEEGRRILHTLLAFLIAQHKLGKSYGGDWVPRDWDVEDSRTVSLSKVPTQFTDASLPAQDFAQLDTSVVTKYLPRRHLSIPPKKKRPKLLFINSFREDLTDTSGSLSTHDYHELMASHPFIMPSEARSDLLFAMYRFFKTFDWESKQAYNYVFADKGFGLWTTAITSGNSKVLKKIFWHKWDRRNAGLPYDLYLRDLLVFQRHALEHIRNHEQVIQKMMELELLVSDRAPGLLPRLIRLMFQHKKIEGEVKRRWDIYVGAGANKRL